MNTPIGVPLVFENFACILWKTGRSLDSQVLEMVDCVACESELKTGSELQIQTFRECFLNCRVGESGLVPGILDSRKRDRLLSTGKIISSTAKPGTGITRPCSLRKNTEKENGSVRSSIRIFIIAIDLCHSPNGSSGVISAVTRGRELSPFQGNASLTR